MPKVVMKGVIVYFMLVSVASFGQVRISGKVLDEDEQALSYANIGFSGKTIGTVSDSSGYFELFYDEELLTTNDSLRISMLGYHPLMISIDSLDSSNTITLHKQVLELEEVIITSAEYREKKRGKLNASAINMSCNFSLPNYKNQNLGSEIGKRFNIPNRTTFIDTLRFYVLQNNYNEVKFRINIYSVKKNKPDKRLLHQSLISKVSNKYTGWVTIDLTPFNICVKDDVVVALEWIYKSANGTTLSLPISMPVPTTHYYKHGSQNSWKKYNSMSTKMQLYIRF